MNNAMNFSYEYLKQEIKQYEIQEQLSFDNTLQELRRDKFTNRYSSITDKYTGNVFHSTNSGDFMVTEYFNYDKIAIVFMNTGYRMLA